MFVCTYYQSTIRETSIGGGGGDGGDDELSTIVMTSCGRVDGSDVGVYAVALGSIA